MTLKHRIKLLSLRSLVDYAYFTVLKSEYQEGRLIATEKKFDVGGLGNRRCMRIAKRDVSENYSHQP